MTNTSATGGPLSPDPSPAPLEGQALNRFFQQWLVGIIGIDPTLVRPRYQTEPPDIPNAGTAWMAFGYGDRTSDVFPYIFHDPSGQGEDELHRHEMIEIKCSFYDLGTNGQADSLAALLRDSLSIAQNSELLQLNDMAIAYTGEVFPVPVLLKTRWQYRVDFNFKVRRRIVRRFPVLNILTAEGTIVTDSGFTDNF